MGSNRARARTLILITLAGVLTSACERAQSPEGQVEGLVIAVDGNLTSVERFTMLTDDGEIELVAPDETLFLFPEPHLREHLRSGEAITVEYRTRNGELIAVTVDDAS